MRRTHDKQPANCFKQPVYCNFLDTVICFGCLPAAVCIKSVDAAHICNFQMTSHGLSKSAVAFWQAVRAADFVFAAWLKFFTASKKCGMKTDGAGKNLTVDDRTLACHGKKTRKIYTIQFSARPRPRQAEMTFTTSPPTFRLFTTVNFALLFYHNTVKFARA